MRKPQAIALVTALLVAQILFVLGLAFLFFIERDYRSGGLQEKGQEAFYLALSGIEYANCRPDLLPVSGPLVTRSLPSTDPFHYFEVQRLADGSLKSHGVVGTALKIFADRTLVVDAGQPTSQYRDASL